MVWGAKTGFCVQIGLTSDVNRVLAPHRVEMGQDLGTDTVEVLVVGVLRVLGGGRGSSRRRGGSSTDLLYRVRASALSAQIGQEHSSRRSSNV
jgi:hypothetical protein